MEHVYVFIVEFTSFCYTEIIKQNNVAKLLLLELVIPTYWRREIQVQDFEVASNMKKKPVEFLEKEIATEDIY